MKDYFVSYTATDRVWAEWVAYKLEELGYEVVIQAWDFAPGEDFVDLMHRALSETRHTIGVLSTAYLQKAFPRAELAASLAGDPLGRERKFIPIRIEDFPVPGLLVSKIYIDFVGLNEEAAFRALTDGVGHSTKAYRPKPSRSPLFPRASVTPTRTAHSPDAVGSPRCASVPSGPRCFIHSKVQASDWLPQSMSNPYFPLLDPTDEAVAAEAIALQCFIWMPASEYFSRPSPDNFTPVVLLFVRATCNLAEALRAVLSPEIYSKLELPPSKLFNEDRAKIFPAIGDALQLGLLTAVTIPKTLLAGATSHPFIGYQTILDLVLVPALSFHAQIQVHSIDILLPSLGPSDAYVLSQTKRLAKAILGRSRAGYTVGLAAADSTPMRVCRAVAWGASRHHNRDESQWVQLLDARLNSPS